jgi:mRNA capping enzyme, beta chain
MDTGALTVVGTRPSNVDPLVMRLMSKIEAHLNSAENLEIEGRIGIVCKPRQADERISLPVMTEAVLAPSNKGGFQYEFKSDIGKSTWKSIVAHLTNLCKNSKDLKISHPHILRVSSMKETNTVDESFQLPGGKRARLTDNKGPAISKKRLEIFDVFTGSEEIFDLRFSVNDEQTLPKFNRHGLEVSGRREKHRFTFELSGFVIDMTEVKAKDRFANQVKTTYECEVELKTDLIKEQFARKQAGKNHAVFEILTDFVYVLRDIAKAFASQSDATTTGGADHSSSSGHVAMSDDLVQSYLKHVAPFQPIIGEYLYKIATELKQE